MQDEGLAGGLAGTNLPPLNKRNRLVRPKTLSTHNPNTSLPLHKNKRSMKSIEGQSNSLRPQRNFNALSQQCRTLNATASQQSRQSHHRSAYQPNPPFARSTVEEQMKRNKTALYEDSSNGRRRATKSSKSRNTEGASNKRDLIETEQQVLLRDVRKGSKLRNA